MGLRLLRADSLVRALWSRSTLRYNFYVALIDRQMTIHPHGNSPAVTLLREVQRPATSPR